MNIAARAWKRTKKSLAFRFSLQDTQTTLQDDAVDALMGALGRSVQQRHGATLRA